MSEVRGGDPERIVNQGVGGKRGGAESEDMVGSRVDSWPLLSWFVLVYLVTQVGFLVHDGLRYSVFCIFIFWTSFHGLYRYYIHNSRILLLTATCCLLVAVIVFTVMGLSLHHPYHNPMKVNVRDIGALEYKGVSTLGKITLNENGPSYKIWNRDGSDSPCLNYKTRLGIDIGRVWLVSYPCSGNTWVRYLIEASTGIFTGSVYRDRSLYQKGFLGEYEAITSGTTLTQKSHGFTIYTGNPPVLDSLRRRNKLDPMIPTIFLLRNPIKALISYWHYKMNNRRDNPHLAQAPTTSFQSKEFHTFVNISTYLWEQLAVDILLQTQAPLHVLHYEYLQQNTTHYLGLLMEFLGIPIDDQRMRCVSSHMEGSFKRKPDTSHFDPFTTEERDRFTVAVDKVHRLIKAMGYQDPPVYKNFRL